MKLGLIAFVLLGSILIPAQISPPRAGFVRYEDRSMHPVLGIPGNLLLTVGNFAPADAASFSDKLGLTADQEEIKLWDPNRTLLLGRWGYREAHPILSAADHIERCAAWLPKAHALLVWTRIGFQLMPVPMAPTGTVTSLTMESNTLARLLVSNADRSVSAVTISVINGEIVSSDVLPGVSGPAFQLGGFLVSAGGQSLQITSPEGLIERLPFTSHLSAAESMATHWLHLFSAEAGQHWALDLGGSKPVLSLLPAAPDYIRSPGARK